MTMNITAQTLEQLSEATGISRETIRTTFGEITSVRGGRLGAMRQRVSGIMANAQSRGQGDGGVDEVMDYADGSLTTREKSRIFGALGLGFLGGLLMASAAGSIAALLVGLALLIMSGMMLISFYKSITGRLSELLDVL